MNVRKSTATPRIGWALLALSVAFIVGAAFLVRGAPSNVPGLEVAPAEEVVDAVLNLAFALVGALIIARQPRNLFGWAFLLIPALLRSEPLRRRLQHLRDIHAPWFTPCSPVALAPERHLVSSRASFS